MEKEVSILQALWETEDLAVKKTAIYSRLLINTELAKKMEEFSLTHANRKKEIEGLLYGKDGGRCEVKEK